MAELIQQIIAIAKNIAHIFTAGILDPLILIIKSLGLLFVKVLELGLAAAKWLIAQL